MISRVHKHADTTALRNLLINGAMDHLELRDGQLYPHYWVLRGGELYPDDLSVNSFSVVKDEVPDSLSAASDYLVTKLVTTVPVSITQVFTLDPAANVLDFPVPLEPRTVRREMYEGYQSLYDRLLGKNDFYTLELSVRVPSGRVTTYAKFVGDGDELIAASSSVTLSRTTNSKWARINLKISAPSEPSKIMIVVQRADRTELAEVHISNAQLVQGAYDDAPYTGDKVFSAIPRNAVVLCMGKVCPQGFVALEEPPGVAPLSEWTTADARIKARFRAFPIGATAPSTESLGAPTHNRDKYAFNLVTDQVRNFESFLSKFGQSVSTNPTEFPAYNSFGRSPADEATDGVADHQHNVTDAGSIPVNRQFLFCRKI